MCVGGGRGVVVVAPGGGRCVAFPRAQIAAHAALANITPPHQIARHLIHPPPTTSHTRTHLTDQITREPGPVKGGSTVIAFAKDPTGYAWELIERPKTAEPLCQVRCAVLLAPCCGACVCAVVLVCVWCGVLGRGAAVRAWQAGF